MSRTSIGSMLGSCGSSKDDADEPGVPDVNPQLDWNFTYETSQTDDGVVIKWKVEEKTKSISSHGAVIVTMTIVLGSGPEINKLCIFSWQEID